MSSTFSKLIDCVGKEALRLFQNHKTIRWEAITEGIEVLVQRSGNLAARERIVPKPFSPPLLTLGLPTARPEHF
jgi:hypothetical protein